MLQLLKNLLKRKLLLSILVIILAIGLVAVVNAVTIQNNQNGAPAIQENHPHGPGGEAPHDESKPHNCPRQNKSNSPGATQSSQVTAPSTPVATPAVSTTTGAQAAEAPAHDEKNCSGDCSGEENCPGHGPKTAQ